MKYTEEEKKALEDLKECENCHYRDRENCMCEINYDYKKAILNIIEKQQKEIEKQASLIKFDVKYRNQLEQDLYENASNYVISKEKIKNKIKELENIEIERLYKDNYRLDRENQLKFEKAVDTSDYVSKDKIREKIKELKDNRPYLSKFDDWKEKEYTNEDINNMCVEVLEDLLGDE